MGLCQIELPLKSIAVINFVSVGRFVCVFPAPKKKTIKMVFASLPLNKVNVW